MNILGGTRVLGVFGCPIAHSLSPVMHNAALREMNLDIVYVPFHVQPDALDKAVGGIVGLDLLGVNVTIPHKERVIPLLDQVSDQALRIGSVNTVINEDGRLRGETTDGPGFLRSAEAAWGDLSGSKVLILGAGGSAKAVSFALADVGCEIAIANRTQPRGVQLSEMLNSAFGGQVSRAISLEPDVLTEEVGKACLLVNTTSVGMHPDVDGIPIDPQLLRPGLLVYDLVYNPLKTRLVIEAERRGASAVTGMRMLVYQGALSLEMWTGRQAPVDVMEEAAVKALIG